MDRDLKPRTVGDTLGEIFAVFVDNWTTILGVVAAVTLPLLIIQAIVARNIIDYDALANNDLSAVDPEALRNSLVIGLFAFAAQALAAGAVVHSVAGAYAGQRSDVGASISFAASHLGLLIVGSLIWTFGLVFGFILLIIPGIILAVGWVTWASALLIERTTAPGAFSRSWQLTQGRKWQVFGIGLSLIVIAIIIDIIVGSIATGLGQEALAPPNFNTTVLDIAATVLLNGLFSTATVVVYLELRTRKEGAEAVSADLVRTFAPHQQDGTGDLFR